VTRHAPYTIRWTKTAVERLEAISDRRVQRALARRAEDLAESPEQHGKPLLGELVGFRSMRAVGQRYRIIYRVMRREVVVSIVAVGRRKEGDKNDVYELTKKLLRLGLLGK
jgi:mRNA interferase RelE/StbE